MVTTLTTERLSLHTLTVEDHSFIQELLNTNGWLQFIGDRKVHSKEDALAYINKINGTHNIHYWVVRPIETNDPIGIITFMKRPYLEHFDIGFAFLPQYNGQGYAHEAAKAVLSAVCLMPEHATVLATTLPDNIRSIHLLTKLGLQFQTELEIDGKTLRVYSNRIKT